MVGEDRQNNTHNTQKTFVVEIAPLCKVCLDMAMLPRTLFLMVLSWPG
jgi:hypothetical protein